MNLKFLYIVIVSNSIMSSFASRVAVVNANRVDFDRKLDWSFLGDHAAIFWDEIGTNPSDEDIVSRCEGCDVLVTKEIAVTPATVMKLPASIKLICEAGTGFNNIAIDACQQRGISVTNVPSYSETAVATLVITFILNFSSGLIAQQRDLWEGSRTRFTCGLPSPDHLEVEGKILGLIGGRGNIGSKVAATALTLGMKVLISSRSHPSVSEQRDGVEYTDSVDDLLQRSDFVSIHCPLNAETRHLIDARALSVMKPSAYLINTARGAIVDEDALIEALQSGRIAGAALDVQSVEPPAPESPLYTLANCILTPHIGWKRLETRQRLVRAVAENIRHFKEGKAINVVS